MDFYELGKELATLRKSKNISQQTLAKDLHISRATISNFETENSVDIGLKKILQIIDYLGYEINIKEKRPFPVFEDIVNVKNLF
ncbi:helix-turn-helix domain-containing protein [Aliarcobacter butzleri]|uniref:helix-turn-helix domain-containing protein n=1 Tax=Aliarcobacter butzleri TaxID=28197 RepID=UPI002B24FD43|nr:helix-turn-helix transcriptional regulator [Aliarcobacter butzleri]